MILNPAPFGDCLVERRDGEPYIVKADPRILISEELLSVALAGDSPWMTWHPSKKLTFHGRNRVVVYRVGDYQPYQHGYLAELVDV